MKTLLLTLVCLICATTAWTKTVDDLVFITEEYPPFNFTADGKLQGISTDALVEMLKLAGSHRTRDDIGSFPWALGYDVALTRRNVLLYSTTRTAAREHLFEWVGPIVSSEIVLVARKDRGIVLHDVAEINRGKLRIGVVLNDVGEQRLRELGVNRSHIYRYNKGVQLAEMLHNDKIDLLAYGKLATRWNLKSLGYNPDHYQAVFTLQSADYYYALNRRTDASIVKKLQQALDQLKATGRLAAIIKHYLP